MLGHTSSSWTLCNDLLICFLLSNSLVRAFLQDFVGSRQVENLESSLACAAIAVSALKTDIISILLGMYRKLIVLIDCVRENLVGGGMGI